MKDEEQKLLEEGWKKQTLKISIREYDDNFPTKFRMLTYDMANDFTAQQIGIIRNWVNEVNKRFPNIKMFVEGTGYYQDITDVVAKYNMNNTEPQSDNNGND